MNLIRKLPQIRIPGWIKPTFYIGTTLLILIFNDVFGEDDFFNIFSFFFFIALSIELIRWLFVQTKAILTLKKEKKQAELLHLKSQVNPHFFFNTLNNLYGLMEQDMEKAQHLVLKLSDLMRYSIYEGGKDRVTLEEEVTYIENYIELHKMRYHKTIDIKFTVDITADDKKVMPLLFIILVENAFKHGVENLINDAFVHINIEATASEVNCTVQNNFDPEEIGEETGIGLANLRRRLELVYPNKHKLETSSTDTIYTAKLSLGI